MQGDHSEVSGMETLAGCLYFSTVVLQRGKCFGTLLTNDRIRTNIYASLCCPCWEADPPKAGLGWIPALTKSWYALLASVAGGLHSGLDKRAFANCRCCLPLPHLDSTVLRRMEQSPPSAAIQQRVEHQHLAVGWVLLHRWNSKFQPDYAGNKHCQGLSLYSSGRRKCWSFPKPDTVARFCRPEIFWWTWEDDNQLAGRLQRAEASTCNRYGTIIVVNNTDMLLLITWWVLHWKHSYLISIDSFWVNCSKTWGDGAPVSFSDSKYHITSRSLHQQKN